MSQEAFISLADSSSRSGSSSRSCIRLYYPLHRLYESRHLLECGDPFSPSCFSRSLSLFSLPFLNIIDTRLCCCLVVALALVHTIAFSTSLHSLLRLDGRVAESPTTPHIASSQSSRYPASSTSRVAEEFTPSHTASLSVLSSTV